MRSRPATPIYSIVIGLLLLAFTCAPLSRPADAAGWHRPHQSTDPAASSPSCLIGSRKQSWNFASPECADEATVRATLFLAFIVIAIVSVFALATLLWSAIAKPSKMFLSHISRCAYDEWQDWRDTEIENARAEGNRRRIPLIWLIFFWKLVGSLRQTMLDDIILGIVRLLFRKG